MRPRTSSSCRKASTRYGTSLPTTTAIGETGVTISCSSVPRSRSRTIEKAASSVPEKVSRIATSPGMRRLALRESGLNSITGCGINGGLALPTSRIS